MPNYIVKARASYQLQRGVPSDCQNQVGKKKWKEPGGRTRNKARARVPGSLTRTDLAIRSARGEQLTPEEQVLLIGQVPALTAFASEWTEDRSLKRAHSVRDVSLHPLLKSVVYRLVLFSGPICPYLKSVSHIHGVMVIRWGHHLSKPCRRVIWSET